MFRLFSKDVPSIGSVFYRGNIPPRAEEFVYLKGSGVELARLPEAADQHWGLRLRHKDWGEAEVRSLREMPIFPPVLIDWSPSLSEAERAEAKAAGVGVTVTVKSTRKNMLADRKRMLRYLGALMGDDGVVVADHTSELFWSRAMLDDELSHDADLDVDALYSLHAVRAEEAEGGGSEGDGEGGGEDDEEAPVAWLHSHGLARIGAFDFDILCPSPDMLDPSSDVLRALAFAIVEGKVTASTASFNLAWPGGDVRFVPVGEFHRTAPGPVAALRTNDEEHSRDRAVLCEPRRGLLGRFSRSARPSGFLAGEIPDGTVCHFTSAATELMAARARSTVGVLRAVMEEFAEFEFPALVKLGYPTNGAADAGEKEHLWFEVQRLLDGAIDATLVNAPFHVPQLSKGDRGVHGVEMMTDWQVMTPAGPINPRSLRAARRVREHKDEVRQMMELMRAMEAAEVGEMGAGAGGA